MEKKQNAIRRLVVLLIVICNGVGFTTNAQVDSGSVDSLIHKSAVQQDTIIIFQYVKDGQVLDATLIDGDTIPWIVLDEVLFVSEPTFDDDEARRRYFYLKRKVMKVYPYAVLAGNKLDSLNLRLDSLTSSRQKRKYIKEYQEYLEERFEPEIRKLTHSEGQILCKLLYRETGMSVYDLITEYRSGWTAFWWNVTANWNDISLKEPYDPENNEEDKLVENILQRSFTQGLLEERVPFYPPQEEE